MAKSGVGNNEGNEKISAYIDDCWNVAGVGIFVVAAKIESEFENRPESARPGTNRFRLEATLP